MNTRTGQSRKIVPGGEERLSGNGLSHPGAHRRPTGLSPRSRLCSTGGYIRPAQIGLLGGIAVLITVAAGVVITNSSAPVAVATEANPTPLTAKSVHDSGPVTTKPVQPHLVLPVSVTGQPRKQALLPTSIQEALYAKQISFDARLRYINNLGEALSQGDIKLLLDYTKELAPEDGLEAKQRLAFKNDIINILRSQKTPPVELTAVLVGIYNDTRQAVGMRDYAVQHLAEWRWRAQKLDPAAARQIDDALWAAAGETSQTYSGTALLALHRIADTYLRNRDSISSSYQTRLSRVASALAADEKAPVAARVTAVALCGQNPNAETEKLISGILDQTKSPPTLQLAALGALVKTLPASSPLEPHTKAIFERAARSTYSPLRKLAETALRNHTF